MRSIPPGATGSFSLTVAREHLASQFKDASLPPVLATPIMIMMMENAALDAIRSYLDAGESAVGSAVSVRHFAATALGHRVTATAVVTNVTGRKIEFAVSARDEAREIGNGTHERTVVDVRRLMERLESQRQPES
jgi:fluoroacetyl-CoA thioesterase